LLLDVLTPFQCSKIKGSIVDMNNRFNEVFSFFNSLNSEFAPGARLINIFSSYFLFHLSFNQSKKNIESHIHLLDEITLKFSSDPTIALVISDVNIKNNVAAFISHIHIHNKPVCCSNHSPEQHL